MKGISRLKNKFVGLVQPTKPRVALVCAIAFAVVSLSASTALYAQETATAQLFDRAEFLRHRKGHREAARIYELILFHPNLEKEDEIRARCLLAETLEAVPGRGEEARQTYRKIRDLYPDEPVSAAAACRLGTLYHSISLDGTKKSIPDAVEQYEYVLRHAPHNRMVALKAHMGLGNLSVRMGEYDKAEAHYRAIYDVDPDTVERAPGAAFIWTERRYLKPGVLEDAVRYGRDRAALHLVGVCMRGAFAESLVHLRALVDRYPDDQRIKSLVQEKLKKLLSVRIKDADDVERSVAEDLLYELETGLTLPAEEPQSLELKGRNAVASHPPAKPAVSGGPPTQQVGASGYPSWPLVVGGMGVLALGAGMMVWFARHRRLVERRR